ncbi:MAG TPA: deoxyguanosinetriphosphate triphosphohydrolase [Hyphomicrobiaceae bacterium]|nr:deoxyguanosinetriphosphate triphosphohydrolase [Hyphomicrobiaceae bacterium]
MGISVKPTAGGAQFLDQGMAGSPAAYAPLPARQSPEQSRANGRDGGPARPVAAYAAHVAASAGRLNPEAGCPMRTAYQRDRDRIIHATAFRRLTYKTQVFVFHEGDHYRTRLTHSLEVAQIARAIARMLELDEDLAEALALAHDLGHTPFGHAGERALAEAAAAYGGFDHNAQSLKVVTRLERKYAAFDGLNLTFETLEGLAKHNGPLDAAMAPRDDQALLRRVILEAGLGGRLHMQAYAPAEAQAAAIADDIAYASHDLDDGLRAGLIGFEDLADVPLVGPFMREAQRAGVERSRVIYEVKRRIITAMIDDVVHESRCRLAALAAPSLDSVRAAGRPLIDASPPRRTEIEGLQRYLFANVYRHPRLMRIVAGAEAIVSDLFGRYLADIQEMPPSWREAAERSDGHAGGSGRAGVVVDFVAGMTDRFAIQEHRRLFDATPELR